MNRGFGKYFKTGVRSAAGAILKGGRIFKYYAYFLVSRICLLIPFINVLFQVADVRHAKIAKEEGQMSFARAFGGIDTGNAFGAALLAYIIKYLIILGGVIVIGIIGAVLYFVSAIIASLTDMSYPILLPIIFVAPAAIAEIIYVLVMLFRYAPVAYIVDSNTNLRASEVLSASSETMRFGGKMTCFLNVFIPLLIKGVYLALVSAGFYVIMSIGLENARVLICAVYAVIAAIPYIVFAPVLTLSTTIANNCLFEDIALDPASMSYSTKGVMIKRCSVTNSLAGKGRDSNLEALFASAPKATMAPPATKYVPPTDRAEKLRVYEEEVETVPIIEPEDKPVSDETYKPVPEPEAVKPIAKQEKKTEPIEEDGLSDDENVSAYDEDGLDEEI